MKDGGTRLEGFGSTPLVASTNANIQQWVSAKTYPRNALSPPSHLLHKGHQRIWPEQSAIDMASEMATGTHQGLLSIGQHATQRYLGLDRGGHGQLRKDWSAVWNARHRPVSQSTSSRADSYSSPLDEAINQRFGNHRVEFGSTQDSDCTLDRQDHLFPQVNIN
ncbi:uncharacterized protein LOC119770683 [Culex quinquefasciatus]|uniref:uncharacterized protein LOC119770683 n=1 Tax=Culex quinquefasciatus TaxID=7176 RepID=UPI0018E3A16C|nr:uncharacterized protein LOC119770683 [Culex quinquefasciatus]